MAGLFSGMNEFLYGNNQVQDAEIRRQQQAQLQNEQLLRQREQQDYQRQADLASYLNQVISGQAPSVAQGQLVAGQDAASRQMMAQAAGANGQMGGLARYGSILGGGELMAQTNQQAAQLRAQEQAMAAQNLGQVSSSMGGRSGQMAMGSGQMGLDYGKLYTGVQGMNVEQTNKENAATMKGIGDAVSYGLSSYGDNSGSSGQTTQKPKNQGY